MNKIVLSLMGIMLLSGCSTIIEGSTQTVNFSTGMDKQIHAVITSSGGTMPVILPQALAVNKSSNDLVINIKDGNCVLPSTTIVKSHLNPWFWFDNRLRFGCGMGIRQQHSCQCRVER